MKRRLSLTLMGILFLALIGVGLYFLQNVPQPKGELPGTAKLTLLHQSNRLAEIEPCGCHYNQNGGLDREANAVSDVRKESAQVLYVDSGNAFSPFKSKLPVEHFRERAKAVVAGYNASGLDLFAPGPADFRLGVSALKELEKDSKFAWVSTNVQAASGLTPIFAPYQIISREGVNYGVLGLSDPKKISGDVVAEQPETALRTYLPKLKERADVIIVLSQLGPEAERQLSERFPEIQLFVGADTRFGSNDPVWLKGRSLLVDNEDRGYKLGRLDITWNFPFKGFSSPAMEEQNQLELTMLQAEAQKDPSLAKNIENFKIHKDLNPIPGASTYQHSLIALSADPYGKPNAVSQIIATEKERVRKKALAE